MIQSKQDLKYFIQQDRFYNQASDQLSIESLFKRVFSPNLRLRYLYLLRKSEYYLNRNRYNIIGWVYFWRYRRLGLKLGFSIPLNVFGPGLSLPHYGPIVVNQKAKIGANCRLHVCTNIGASAGGSEAPKLGDNVYIGPGAILFGDITIADNVTIGANATVNKSFEQQNVVLAGSPASIVKETYPNWIEFNKIK